MAENSGGINPMIIVGIIGIGLIAVYMYMKNKSGLGGTSYNIGTTLDQAVAAGQQQAISGYAPVPFSPGLDFNIAQTGPNRTGAVSIPGYLTQGVIADNYNKPGLPIISGSTKDIDDPAKYAKTAAGLCQCNDQKCCYWAPYYAKNGLKTSVSKNVRCVNIQYGNAVQACDRAFSDFENDATGGMARVEAYRGLAVHYATRPVAAFRAQQLASSRYARAMR